MNDLLASALAPVIADVRATGVPEPRIEASVWTGDPGMPAAMLWSTDGSGVGIFVRAGDEESRRVAHAAEQVQDWVIEECPASAANWPPCPAHPGSHALSPVVVGGVAEWACATERVVVAPLGGLRTAGADRA